MKKTTQTPIQDKIAKSEIRALFSIINDCMETIREAEKEKIIETNNNYFVYKKNYDYIKRAINAFDRNYIYGLFSDDDKNKLAEILRELNMLSVTFNVNIKQFNDSEKRKRLLERAHLKTIKMITFKHFANER